MASGSQLDAFSKIFDRNLLKNGDTYDKTLLWVLLCLLAFGFVMVFSAGSGVGSRVNQLSSQKGYLLSQMMFAGLGLATAYVLSRTKPVSMWRWHRWTKWMLLVSIVLLVITIWFGREINGAKRWLPLLVFNIQPSELFKLTAIMYMASFFQRRKELLVGWKITWQDCAPCRRVLFRCVLLAIVLFPIVWAIYGIKQALPVAAVLLVFPFLPRHPALKVCAPIGLGLGIIVKFNSDLGTAVVVFAIAAGLLVLANLPQLIAWLMMAFGALSVAALIVFEPYRLKRVVNMFTPWKDQYGQGYQNLGSLMSLEHGGMLGTGLGGGIFKRGYLPEAHTDFIVAVIAEELGWVTLVGLVLVYVWIIWRIFRLARRRKSCLCFLTRMWRSASAFGWRCRVLSISAWW